MDPLAMDVSVSDPISNDPPLSASTPKKLKPKKGSSGKMFTCRYCDKEYKVKFYFERHVQSHELNLSSRNVDAPSTVNLDVSDLSFSVLDNTSFKVPAIPKPFQRTPASAIKSKSKPKAKPKFTCTYCLKGYICSRSFQSHCRTHAIQDAAVRFPNKEKILGNIQEIAVAALTIVANAPCSGSQGALFRQETGYLVSILASQKWKDFSRSLCEELLDSVLTQRCLLPSALLSSLFNKVEDILSSPKVCEDLLETLDFPLVFNQHMQSLFMLEFVLNFAQESYSFISKTFRSGRANAQKPPPQLDDEDKQVIYYIGGSIIRGYLRIGYRYKNSKTWEKIVKVLKCNVLKDKPSMENEQFAQWTSSLDRGGLLYLNNMCQNFFIGLTAVVFSCEKRDGSIDYEEVIRTVSNSELSVQWDSMISNSLDEKNSLNLMNDVIRCFCRTCCRGFAKRRLNFLRNRPVVSMPTRHAVARRKKT